MIDEEIERLLELLRVQSISADPAHEGDMLRAAELVADEVRRAGGTAQVVTTSGHPLVVGEVPPSDDAPDAPVVTIYGHYDVQPPGDLSLWTSPPFRPEIRDGMVFARGATDDKGNMFMLLVALQRLRAQGRLTVRARVLIDGEEESGGHSAVDFIAAEEHPARAAVIFDSPMIAPGRPAVCTGLRGLAYFRVTVRGGDADLHSGMYGGAALNSIHALMQVLDAVVMRGGRVPAPLLEGTPEPSPAEVDAWATLPGGDELLAQAGEAARWPRRGGVPPPHHDAAVGGRARGPRRQPVAGGHGDPRRGRGHRVVPHPAWRRRRAPGAGDARVDAGGVPRRCRGRDRGPRGGRVEQARPGGPGDRRGHAGHHRGHGASRDAAGHRGASRWWRRWRTAAHRWC